MHLRNRLVVCAVLLIAGAAHGEERNPLDFAIAIHGGAGRAPQDEELQNGRRAVMEQALRVGKKMLADGKTSLETVEAVIRILEDSPYINAGKGAVFNAAGGHELDASIMDGQTRACGAVGGVSTVRNPITLARFVMTDTRHVLLVTDGAEKFADGYTVEQGIERVENTFFSTDHRRTSWEKAKARTEQKTNGSGGTCGCVALDKQGNLAAGTSTGGLTNKKYGRIGDSPIISAGTYADNRTCAVSCTGTGEDFIRYAVAFDVSARLRYKDEPLDKAVHAVLHDPEQLVRGGIIAVGRDGTISMQFNSPGMLRAAADSAGRHEVHLSE